MKLTLLALSLVLVFSACPGLANASRDEHPIGKVITMLEGLMEKVEMEGKTEEVEYMKFEYWCKNSIKTVSDAITEEKATIDSLESTIEAKQKQNETLTKQIGELEVQIGDLEEAGTKAEESRKEGRKLYETSEADYKSTLDAIDQAIKAIEDSRSIELLHVKSKVQKVFTLIEAITSVDQSSLTALHAYLGHFGAGSAPAAAGPAAAKERPELKAEGDYKKHEKVYNFKSGDVIELLKELKMKFEDELTEATKEETNAQNSFDLSKQARDNAIEAAKSEKEEKTTMLSTVQSKLAEAKADLETTKDNLEADEKTLEETKTDCKTKEGEWEERTEIRKQELEAMEAAIKILSEVSGVSTEPPNNPIPPPPPVEAGEGSSFMQILSSLDPKMKAVTFLRKQARITHSKALERLAQEISAHLTGPFDEVKQMIQKMIFRLMSEQKDEDDHKNWCDKELSKTNSSKADKEDKIEELDGKIEEAQATIQKLAQEIKSADEMVAAIVQHIKEAKEIREIGKKQNAVAIKDAQDAQTAIANAIAVLEEHYKETGEVPKESWEFLQRQPVELPEKPSTWDSSYTGVTDPTKQPDGVISVLKKTSEDFAKMEADTKAQEAEDKKAYEEEMQDLDIEKSRRVKESELKTEEKKRLVDKIAEMQAQKKQTSDELDAVMQYIKDLQPACVEGDSDYETRKAARTKEIEALQEAQQILADAFKAAPAPAAASFLQHSLRGRVA